MISLKDIEKVTKTANSIHHTLKGVTLDIEQGEIFGIIGRPGAGKSALIRTINLLEKPSHGSVIVDSCNLTALTTEQLRLARRSIGMIFQHFNLLSSRTVFNNIALPLEIMGHSRTEIEHAIHPILELTGLNDKVHAYPHELTNGFKQRVAIARALVNRPKILLCEDATASLDPKTTQSILQLLSDINEQLNLTLLMITHEIDVIKSICQRVAVLNQGEIVEQASVLSFFAHPKSEIGKEFVKTATRLEMPTALRRRMRPHPTDQSNPVLRLSFLEQAAQETLLAHIIQHFSVTLNILSGHLETINQENIGVMIVELSGNKDNIQKSISFLEQKGIYIEVLGYAPRTA